MTGEWIDVSVPLYTGMAHWPNNPPVRIEPVMSIPKGDTANVSLLSMGSHTGTHMDSPHHFFEDGVSIDRMPLEATVGPARVIEIADDESVTRAELEQHSPRRGERLLIKTQNSTRCWTTDTFVEDFVYVSADAATYLAECGIRTLGVDYLSVGGYFHDGVATHHALLGAGIWVVEGLNLSQVRPGSYDMVGLPLKIRGGDGAPSRVILRAAEEAPVDQ